MCGRFWKTRDRTVQCNTWSGIQYSREPFPGAQTHAQGANSYHPKPSIHPLYHSACKRTRANSFIRTPYRLLMNSFSEMLYECFNNINFIYTPIKKYRKTVQLFDLFLYVQIHIYFRKPNALCEFCLSLYIFKLLFKKINISFLVRNHVYPYSFVLILS